MGNQEREKESGGGVKKWQEEDEKEKENTSVTHKKREALMQQQLHPLPMCRKSNSAVFRAIKEQLEGIGVLVSWEKCHQSGSNPFSYFMVLLLSILWKIFCCQSLTHGRHDMRLQQQTMTMEFPSSS